MIGMIMEGPSLFAGHGTWRLRGSGARSRFCGSGDKGRFCGSGDKGRFCGSGDKGRFCGSCRFAFSAKAFNDFR
jgi:hypothetical protein